MSPPDLLNLYKEIIMRKINNLEGINFSERNINNIRHDDDTILVTDTENKLRRLIRSLNEASVRKGLKMNKKKTEVIVITRKDESPRTNIVIEGNLVQQVDKFNYPGSMISCNGRCEEEIKRRIQLT